MMNLKQHTEMENYIGRLEGNLECYERNSEGYNVYKGKLLAVQDMLHIMGKYVAHEDGKAIIMNYRN